ncbi:hypothetical protein OPV22_027054 [Ensete ventricosum]|uniref:Uncharacterized protein n=1 Tax=Ensete ventricosum TaxID=4639 RepID=A0AAV8P4Z2_ENSVE|nr:hypothetical protein OPV22_027054 [Ensete ventricosum]
MMRQVSKDKKGKVWLWLMKKGIHPFALLQGSKRWLSGRGNDLSLHISKVYDVPWLVVAPSYSEPLSLRIAGSSWIS